MENIFKYYEFSEFFLDKSNTFSDNEISFTELNSTHFLIFEKVKKNYNLYVSRYNNKKEIGIKPPVNFRIINKKTTTKVFPNIDC